MKALVYTGPGTVDYREVEDPAPQAGESLLRVEACCICGSDMHAFHGRDERRKPPLILGHEAVGTVLAGPRAGRRVVVNPLVSCGACDYCREGRGNLCGSRQRSEEHTSELQSLMRISYDVFCLKKKNNRHNHASTTTATTRQ